MAQRRRIQPHTTLHRLPPHLERYRRQPSTEKKAEKTRLPAWARGIAVLGMVVFWLAWMGWLGLPKTRAIQDKAFGVFCFTQVPLLWCWIQQQQKRLRKRGGSDTDEAE